MGMNLVIIPAGVPRNPEMTRDDLFKSHARIARHSVKGLLNVALSQLWLLRSDTVGECT